MFSPTQLAERIATNFRSAQPRIALVVGGFALLLLAASLLANINGSSQASPPAGPTPGLNVVNPLVHATPTARPVPATTSTAHNAGCPTGACPHLMGYAVEGCTCANQTYDSASINAPFCCSQGFSNAECPEALAEQATLESIFGSTQQQIEAELVEVELQSWKVSVNAKIAPALQQVNQAIQGMSYTIREPIGCFNWDVIPGSQVLSLHAFAVALDINPSTNPSCGVTTNCRCDNELITDMPAEFVQAFKNQGFDWGGDWVEHPDPMHFEWNGWH